MKLNQVGKLILDIKQRFYDERKEEIWNNEYLRRNVIVDKICTVLVRKMHTFDGICSKFFSCRVKETDFFSGTCLEKVPRHTLLFYGDFNTFQSIGGKCEVTVSKFHKEQGLCSPAGDCFTPDKKVGFRSPKCIQHLNADKQNRQDIVVKVIIYSICSFCGFLVIFISYKSALCVTRVKIMENPDAVFTHSAVLDPQSNNANARLLYVLGLTQH